MKKPANDEAPVQGLPPRLLLVREVAETCRVSERTAWTWIMSGDLVSVRVGGARRVEPAALADFIAKGRSNRGIRSFPGNAA